VLLVVVEEGAMAAAARGTAEEGAMAAAAMEARGEAAVVQGGGQEVGERQEGGGTVESALRSSTQP